MLLVSFIFNIRSRISFILHRSSSTIIYPREKQGKIRWHFSTRTGRWRFWGASSRAGAQPGGHTGTRLPQTAWRTERHKPPRNRTRRPQRTHTAAPHTAQHTAGWRTERPRGADRSCCPLSQSRSRRRTPQGRANPAVPPFGPQSPSRAATWLVPAVVLALHGGPPAPPKPGGWRQGEALSTALTAETHRLRTPPPLGCTGPKWRLPSERPPADQAHARVPPAPFSSRPGAVALARVRGADRGRCRRWDGREQALWERRGCGCIVRAGGNWAPISMVANWQRMFILCFMQPEDSPCHWTGQIAPQPIPRL